MVRARRTVMRKPAPVLKVGLQCAIDKPGLPTLAHIKLWARAALLKDAEVTFRIVGRREGRILNRQFRGKEHATNVLTFAYTDHEPFLGDIVLCAPVIAKEASEQHKTLQAHYAHLVVHGMLHLQGHDHETAKDAKIMEALETQIIMQLGYADPYAPCQMNKPGTGGPGPFTKTE